MISIGESKNLLKKWLEMNKKKSKELATEFVINGYNTKGVMSFSVVPELVRDRLEKKWKSFQSFIYSIELKSSSRKLDLPDYDPIKV
jgi:hypothetical protein